VAGGEAARLIEDLPNEAWRYAALEQLRRLEQLGREGGGAYVVGEKTGQETEVSEEPSSGSSQAA
jgi:hypothetical protein